MISVNCALQNLIESVTDINNISASQLFVIEFRPGDCSSVNRRVAAFVSAARATVPWRFSSTVRRNGAGTLIDSQLDEVIISLQLRL